MKQVEIINLKFFYSRKRELFNNLNLSVEAGRIYGLLGKNGAGKTTLLKLMAGLLFPKEGECNLFDEVAAKRLPSSLREIFVVPEEFYLPSISIDCYAKLNSGYYPRFDSTFFYKYLNEIKLTSDQKLNKLSYGQKKKVLIGFALATNCKLLILDEPTNGLDIPSKSQFRKIIASTLTDDRSIIISTHQVRDLANMLDSIIILEEGKVVMNKSIEDITSQYYFDRKDEIIDSEVLYNEKILGEYSCISENKNNRLSEVDIELLFNAVINNAL